MSERPGRQRLIPARSRLNRLKLSAVAASVVSFAALSTLIADQVEATPIAASAPGASPTTSPLPDVPAPPTFVPDNQPAPDPTPPPQDTQPPVTQPPIVTATS